MPHELPKFCCCILIVLTLLGGQVAAEPLSGTSPLKATGDIASDLVAGVDRFLLRELKQSVERRNRFWQRDLSTPEAYQQSIEPNRKRLAHRLGVRDQRVKDTEPRLMAKVSRSALIGRGDGYEVFAITWPAFSDVTGRGLILIPTQAEPAATVIAIPDCGVLPEQLVGLLPGVPPQSQYARRLAENGCQVIVPLLINREPRLENLTNREWLYRSAFEMGRGLIAYEVQKVLAVVDWASRLQGDAARVGVIGWGEGGLVSLYAAALDPRINAACVSGYFAPREQIWQEPLDRNVFGLLEEFGDAELAAMIAPRPLIVEAAAGPTAKIPGGRGAPAHIVSPRLVDVQQEVNRTQDLCSTSQFDTKLKLVLSGQGQGPCGSEIALSAFLKGLSVDRPIQPPAAEPESYRADFDTSARHTQQLHELDRHTQSLLKESHYLRQQKISSRFQYDSIASYEKSAEPLRDFFYDEVIGRFKNQVLPPDVRTRVFRKTAHWNAYAVVMDVYPDVIATGLLLLPNDLKPEERRPVVVCQHGLEGRPGDTINREQAQTYSRFAAALAERGFITFAPQNLYLFEDRFRTLQRKANPLKKTLFSIITPQHQQIVDWLQTLDFVDPDRIGFYGLSYGGKTAMRVPALVTDYCLSICSADFNEWVDKNASTRNPRSYVHSGEYEIFEFDLGSTFNYAEMAALIAPRPFMVERGHFDGVADDWTVAYEYAKVRHLYAAKLGIPDRTRIEWFAGQHKIHGKGTFEFLHEHLNWPE